jgi:hypothetical protein
MAEKPGFKHIGSASADEQQMAQIREILFGEQQRRISEQLAAIERRLEEQLADMRTLLDQRVNQVRDQLHQDIDKQGMRQQAALDGLDNALRALLQGLDDKITLIDSDLQDAEQRQRQALADQAAEHERLQQDSVSRRHIAELLEQMARTLRGDGAS